MNDTFVCALKKKEAFLKVESQLLRQARSLFVKGFFPGNISSSQMGGVGERLQTSESFSIAQKKTTDFLARQLKKLEAKEERTQKRTSWRTKPLDNGEEESLGSILIAWIQEEKYLEGIDDTKCPDRLMALRRFWSNLYGQYLHKRTFGKDMSLEKED